MQDPTHPSINSWLEDELYSQYRHDRKTVDTDWSQIFETNGHTNGATPVAPALATTPQIAAPVARPTAPAPEPPPVTISKPTR